MNFSKVKLHPQTIKYMKLGHPWVTEDSYTKKFPQDQFLIGIDDKNKECAVLLNDPDHPKVKARVWDQKNLTPFNEDSFRIELKKRIEKSFKKRSHLITSNIRDNLYLVFGEADLIPGFFLQKLKDQYVLSLYSDFWLPWIKDELILFLKDLIFQTFPNTEKENFNLWLQKRNKAQAKKIINLTNSNRESIDFNLLEYGVYYKIAVNHYYDYGIYTDMSALRPIVLKKTLDFFPIEKVNVLNLFCYTGAYSLFFLKHKCQKVVSVDLSKKYLEWLQVNIDLNSDLESQKHMSICKPTKDALLELRQKKEEYELIISDPPSASSDGDKISSSLMFYEKDLELILTLLAPKGIAVLFLNTHTITRKKFEEKINQSLSKLNFTDKFQIIKRCSLEDDCPTLKGFIEGDYLKGIFVQRIS